MYVYRKYYIPTESRNPAKPRKKYFIIKPCLIKPFRSSPLEVEIEVFVDDEFLAS